MKTSYRVTLETTNMRCIGIKDDDDNLIEDSDVTEEVVEQIHDIFRRLLSKTKLEEDLSEGMVDMPYSVEEWNDLDDYGDIKITVTQIGEVKL